MIRIKVFPLKKILYRIEIFLAYLSFLIVILVLISILVSRKQIRAETFLSSNVGVSSAKMNNENIINKIIKTRIRFLSKVDFENLNIEINEAKEDYQMPNISDEILIGLNDSTTIENSTTLVNQTDDIKVNLVEFQDWDKPSEYNTKLYDNGKVLVGDTLINNYSKLNLNLNDLKKPSDFLLRQETSFLIFHTHTSETYTIDSTKYSDYYRTEDENYNIVSVGKVLEEELKAKGYDAIQDKTIHDFPSYNGAYKASLATVQKHLNNKKYDFVIDIHRDAISSNSNFRPTTQINGESVAKLMFVIGTDAAGLSHDEWMKNLKLAIMIQNRANEMYPRFV